MTREPTASMAPPMPAAASSEAVPTATIWAASSEADRSMAMAGVPWKNSAEASAVSPGWPL